MSLFTSLILVATGVGVLVLLFAQVGRNAEPLAAYRLHFASGLDNVAVAEFLSGLSGWLKPWWWRRLFSNPFIVLETHAEAAGLQHFLLVEIKLAPRS